jgi:hypothetical protein
MLAIFFTAIELKMEFISLQFVYGIFREKTGNLLVGFVIAKSARFRFKIHNNKWLGFLIEICWFFSTVFCYNFLLSFALFYSVASI